MKTKSFDKKLMAYSATALGLIVPSQKSDAQILYTDLHEDRQFGDTSSFIFDLNYDNFHDLMVFQGFSATAQMIMLQRAQDTEILAQSQNSYMYPFALSANYQLDTINKNWRIRDFGTMNFQGSNAYGYWQGVTDKYLGLKIKIKGKAHFGWARLDVAQNGKSFVVKDYAFEFTPEKPIKTGEGMNTYGVTAISGLSINDGKAIKVTFNKAFDESKVMHYRLFLKRESDTNQFTPQAALNLSPSRYKIINKTGNNHEIIADGTFSDIQGFDLKSGVNYQVWILSMPDGVNAVEPILSTNKKYFSFVEEAPPTGKPIVKDIGNKGNGQDIEVTFTKAVDESKVGQYKVLICKTDKAASITVDDVKKLNPSRITDVAKTGADIQVVLSAIIQDSDGDLIKNNIKYKALVVSVADGVKTSKNKMSEPSDEFELINTSDIGNLADKHVKIIQGFEKIIIISEIALSPMHLILIDNSGKIIRQAIYDNNNYFELSTTNLSKGIYYVQLYSKDLFLVKNVIIH